MAENFDTVDVAIHAIAIDDGRDAPHTMDPRIRAELRRRAGHARPAELTAGGDPRPDEPRLLARAIGFAMAAALAGAVLGSLWIVARQSATGDRTKQQGNGARAEVMTEFMPLMYSSIPYTDAQIVRFDVPRETLSNFGLVLTDSTSGRLPDFLGRETVAADVLVGEDGLARAVRFVRAERAAGVTP